MTQRYMWMRWGSLYISFRAFCGTGGCEPIDSGLTCSKLTPSRSLLSFWPTLENSKMDWSVFVSTFAVRFAALFVVLIYGTVLWEIKGNGLDQLPIPHFWLPSTPLIFIDARLLWLALVCSMCFTDIAKAYILHDSTLSSCSSSCCLQHKSEQGVWRSWQVAVWSFILCD